MSGTETLEFEPGSGASIGVSWAGGSATLQAIEDLPSLLKRHKHLDAHSLERIGMAAVLFAARDLQRWGMDLGASNLSKALDSVYLRTSDPARSEVLEAGTTQAMDLVRKLRSERREGEIVQRLVELICSED